MRTANRVASDVSVRPNRILRRARRREGRFIEPLYAWSGRAIVAGGVDIGQDLYGPVVVQPGPRVVAADVDAVGAAQRLSTARLQDRRKLPIAENALCPGVAAAPAAG